MAWTSNTVLVVNTRFDPATRYEGALQVQSLLPNSSLVEVRGWRHAALIYSEDADAAGSGYLLSGAPPPDGILVEQDCVPLQAPAAAPLRAGRRRGRPRGKKLPGHYDRRPANARQAYCRQ
jgi:hypothetical protein